MQGNIEENLDDIGFDNRVFLVKFKIKFIGVNLVIKML